MSWLRLDEAPGHLPAEIEGVRVAAWASPQDAADALGTTPRTLARWERRGLPVRGSGHDKLYPFPHAVIWAVQYEVEKQSGGGRSDLTVRVALARHNLKQVQQGHAPIFVDRHRP